MPEYHMIAVLNYATGGIDIVIMNRPVGTSEEMEEYLSDVCGYHMNEIEWMEYKGKIRHLHFD